MGVDVVVVGVGVVAVVVGAEPEAAEPAAWQHRRWPGQNERRGTDFAEWPSFYRCLEAGGWNLWFLYRTVTVLYTAACFGSVDRLMRCWSVHGRGGVQIKTERCGIERRSKWAPCTIMHLIDTPPYPHTPYPDHSLLTARGRIILSKPIEDREQLMHQKANRQNL